MPILNEVEYQHRTRLWGDIRQYVGKGYFIHFGQTPKMGVRIKGKFHSDPAGVYFYSLDWLASAKRFADGEQFATNYPYWTIVERHPDDHGVIMSRMDYEEVDSIAKRNQWPEFEKISTDYHMDQRQGKNSPAALFWLYVKSCGSGGRSDLISQRQALRGISFIYDDGLGIIHSGEPYQLLVFDPRIIRVVATGNQGQPDISKPEQLHGHRFAFVELLKLLRGQYGGEIVWKNKLPSLSFNVSGASFKLSWTISTWDASLRMETKWGRATKSYRFTEHDFKNRTMDEVVGYFTDIVTKTAALAKAKKDMFFTPSLSEKDALAGLRTLISDDGFALTTEIDNDHKQMTVLAEKTVPLGDKGELFVNTYCISGENVRWAINVKIGHYTIASARSSDMKTVGATLKTNFDESLESIEPNSDAGTRKFYYDEEYKAFIGMVAELSGIKSLLEDYPDEVAVWNNTSNKNEIFREAIRIY